MLLLTAPPVYDVHKSVAVVWRYRWPDDVTRGFEMYL